MKKRYCLNCKEYLEGRRDQKYCNARCRSSYHRSIKLQSSVQSTIHKILLRNHKILEELFTIVPFTQMQMTKKRIDLSKIGFNFDYCTRVYQNNRGKWYRYIYDYRWMEFSDQKVVIYRTSDI